MSQEDVEMVRRWLALWDGVDVVAVFQDDATWTRTSAEIEALFEPDYAVAWIAQGQRVIEASGLNDSRRGWLDWLEPWETYHFQIERIFPVGDRVVVLMRLQGRMAATQNEVEMLGGSVYLVRTGGWPASSTIQTRQRPSKPWGCGSRPGCRYSSLALATCVSVQTPAFMGQRHFGRSRAKLRLLRRGRCVRLLV